MKLLRRHRYPHFFRSALIMLVLFSIVAITVGARGAQAFAGRDPIFGARMNGAAAWLEMPDASNQLYSEYDLAGLAGKLINHNLVDASDCPGQGLQDNNTANECGIERAAPVMFEWQNRFNATILETSQDTGVPPRLLKNLFAWESQFWPRTVFVNTYEYGLGHMTQMGADSTLRWNATFYDSLCASSFSKETCAESYVDQPDEIRSALQGVLIQRVNADCSNCANGLDLALADRSIPIFANTLLSNASFVKYYIKHSTGRDAIDVVSYEDLWKFTLISYNAGPGCFLNAYQNTRRASKPLTWENVSSQLDLGCQGSIPYVKFISNTDRYFPDRDPGLATPVPTENPLPTGTDADTVTAASPTLEITATVNASVSETIIASTATATYTSQADSTDIAKSPTLTTVAESTATVDSAGSTPTATGQIEITGTASRTAVTETPSPVSTLVVESASSTATTTTVAATAGEQGDAPHVQDEIVLKIDPANQGTTLETLKDLGINLAQDSEQIESLDTLVVQVNADQLDQALTSLQQSGATIAEPNYLVQISSLPNDPQLYQQISLWTMQVPQAWDALPSMQEVLVAVVDTGVDVSHPDLADRIWLNVDESGLDVNGNEKRSNQIDDDGNGYVDDWQGWNMVAGDNVVADSQGHGTHIAGIIGAAVNNSNGIAGIAPNSRILPVKVLDNTGFGTYAQVAEGIVYATDMGARVINLGFGGTGSSELLQNAVDYALAHGALVIAAGGNGGGSTMYYPAGYPGVIAVASTDDGMSWAPFSVNGGHISLVAPGVGIYSTVSGGLYSTMSGTSMSAAQVSGVAALLAGQPQFVDGNMLRSALLNGALDLGTPGRDPYYGYGMVRAYDSLGYAGPILPTPTAWTVPTSTPGGTPGVFAQASQDLWGRTQVGWQTIYDPGNVTPAQNSIDSAFNDLSSYTTGAYAASSARRWTFTSFDDTTLSAVASVNLDIRFYMTGWVNDTFYIQVYESTNPACSLGWCTVSTLQFTGTQPPSSLTTVTIPVTSVLNSVAKVNAAQVRIAGSALTGGSADTVTIYVDEMRLRVLDALPPTATPTSTPIFIPTSTLQARAITATPLANDPHNNSMAANPDTCSACHRPHNGQGFNLRNRQGEEQTCFICHTSGGFATNIQPAFTLKSNTTTRFFAHDIFKTINVHKTEQDTSSGFGGVNRHVECEDCHAPHDSSRTEASASNAAPVIQQEMYNSTGVDPIWTAAGASVSFTWLPRADREYQLCFKCHSSFTSQPSYNPDGYGWDGSSSLPGYVTNGLFKLGNNSGSQVPDSRDLAKEFNSYQVSFHPVAALGRNRNMPAGSFMAGWSQDSILYCADCHTNANAPTNGAGPHGSPLLHILDGSTEYITKTDVSQSCAPGGCPSIHTTGELCFKCHQYDTYASGANPTTTTNFKTNTENLHAFHSFGSCYTCHDTHGSEQDHLINFDTSVVTIDAGYNSQTAWQFDSATGVGTCYVACHDGEHGTDPNRQYTP